MYVGIELRVTRVNGKRYWRIAPMIIGTEQQRLYVGVIAVVCSFILSIVLLNVARG